jgi:hypothetical protein
MVTSAARMLSPLVSVLRRPRATLARLAERGEARAGLGPMLALGVSYAAFSLLLHAHGHAPSVTLVPLARDRYYLAQSIFAAPLFLALWAIFAGIAHGLARLAGGRGRPGATFAVIGVAYAAPMLFLFLVPDVVVYLVAGHGALAKAMRFYAPVAPLTCVVLASIGLRAAHGLRVGVAIGITLVASLVQAAMGGILLR